MAEPTADDDVLLTIGAFARAVDLAPSALRYYDECGLLVPAEVDTTTGYRYYTPELERRARLIRRLRDVGVPVETMRVVLDGPEEEARRLLAEFASERSDHAARAGEVVGSVLDELEQPDRPASVVIDGPVLASALRQVRGAADNDPASPLSGVLVELDGGRLDVVATNRYWLACRTIDMPAAVRRQPPARAVLPPGSVTGLVDWLDAAGPVGLVLADNRLAVEATDETGVVAGPDVLTREVPWPAHRLILDAQPDPTCRVTADRAELSAGLAAADRSLVWLAIGSGLELGTDTSPAVTVSATTRGATAPVHVSTTLLARAIDSCVGPIVTLELRGTTRPITLGSPYQPGFVALVMPTRVEE